MVLVSEHAVDIEQGRVFGIEAGTQRVIEDELKPRPPAWTKEILEGLHQKVSGRCPIISWDGIDEIPCNRVGKIARIKIHHVIAAPRRDVINNILGQVTVRINDAHPRTPPNI